MQRCRDPFLRPAFLNPLQPLIILHSPLSRRPKVTKLTTADPLAPYFQYDMTCRTSTCNQQSLYTTFLLPTYRIGQDRLIVGRAQDRASHGTFYLV